MFHIILITIFSEVRTSGLSLATTLSSPPSKKILELFFKFTIIPAKGPYVL
jgi:hypothetical protein